MLTREQKRGLMSHKRREKFLYLKHIGKLEMWYKQKRQNQEIRIKPKIKTEPKMETKIVKRKTNKIILNLIELFIVGGIIWIILYLLRK